MTSIAEIWLKPKTIYNLRDTNKDKYLSFDVLVLSTSIPSETSILSKYSINNIHLFKNIVYWIYPRTNQVYYSSIYLTLSYITL